MYVCYLCMYAWMLWVCVPAWAWVRQRKSETAEVNITCNQQMTTQKVEGAEIEGLGRCRGRGEGGRSTNMIIASIFAFFYFCLCPDARNHRQSILDSHPFFMLLCFAVVLICAGFSLPEFHPYFCASQYNTVRSIPQGKCVLAVCIHIEGTVCSIQCTTHVAWWWLCLKRFLVHWHQIWSFTRNQDYFKVRHTLNGKC